MLIHNVYFWLQPNLSDEDRSAFAKGLDHLVAKALADSGSYGKPADTQRAVVDNSYDYGLVLFFEDLAAQDAYQVSSVHEQFIADHADKWQRVQVYDIDV